MSDKKEISQYGSEDHPSDVISILPFLEKSKGNLHEEDITEEGSCKKETDTLDSFLQLIEMSTDDLAGSILAYYIYDVKLSEDLNHELALEELKNRAEAHLDLYEQIKLNFQ